MIRFWKFTSLFTWFTSVVLTVWSLVDWARTGFTARFWLITLASLLGTLLAVRTSRAWRVATLRQRRRAAIRAAQAALKARNAAGRIPKDGENGQNGAER